MTPVAVRTADGRYRPGLLPAHGEVSLLPGAGHSWSPANARLAAGQAASTLLVQAADLVVAHPEWAGSWDQARTKAAALMEGAPMLPDPDHLAEMVLEIGCS